MIRFIRQSAKRFQKTPLLAVATCICIGTTSGSVHAQSMDYGALQQLFGEPVTTSAIGTPQRVRDVPADMEIVTAEDIRRSGAIDIPGVLAHVVGVDVQRWSVLGADVSVRGYNSPLTPRLLVLIDGRQVYNDDFGRTEWAALPVELSEIRQIEIVKGPNSALFGFNAAGGVINIITFNPLYDKVNTASVTAGTQGYRELSAVATAQAGDNLGIRLSAGGTQSNDFQSVSNAAGDQGLQRDTSRDQISADAHWRINGSSELELQATHGEDQRLTETSPWVPIYTHNELNSLLGRYTADTAAGVITATAYSDWSYIGIEHNAPTADGVAVQAVAFKTQVTVVSLQDVFSPATDQTVRITTEYRHSVISTGGPASDDLSYEIGSLGGMWNWNVAPSLSVTAATRLDAMWLANTIQTVQGAGGAEAGLSTQIIEPSYNFGAVWHPTELDRFRLTIARGAQLPSLIEFSGFNSLFSGFGSINGNAALLPTVVKNYEVDWDRDVPALEIQSRVAVFYQTTQDIQSLVSPFGATFTPTSGFVGMVGNIGDSQEVGAEFSVKGNVAEGWRWRLSYSPRLVRDKYKAGANIGNTGTDFADTTPQHVFDASLGWSQGAWEADTFLRLQSSASGLFIDPTQGYVVAPIGPTVAFDARVAYHVGKNVTLSVSGQNVLFSSPHQSVFGKVEQQLLAGLTVSF